ncbi:MAG: DUF5680 domain-containing protein [Patescibacteria group bacterium]|jgi:hypothetical protein
MIVDLKQLTSFIAEANQSGYASGRESSLKKESDGSRTIIYQSGDWLFSDNYFGGEPYGGREVVSYKGQPVFIMTYYGRVSEKDFSEKNIYSFLRKALKLSPPDYPFRGPRELILGEMKYENNWQGDVSYFFGEEKIFINDQEVYNARYVGGLVDC